MKKQAFGFWLSLIAVVVAIVALVLYNQVLVAGDSLEIASGSELFYDPTAGYYATMVAIVAPATIAAIALLVVAVIFGQFQNKVFNMVVGLVRIAIPAVLMVALLQFLYGSFTGLGWTFFSNAELQIYETAIAVGNKVIMAVAIYAVAAVLSVFAAFFPIKKEVKVEE